MIDHVRQMMRVAAAFILESRVNVNKPYKPRKLKTDPYHKLLREAHKRRPKNGAKEAQQQRTRKAWERKNAPALKQREAVVRKQRKALGLD